MRTEKGLPYRVLRCPAFGYVYYKGPVVPGAAGSRLWRTCTIRGIHGRVLRVLVYKTQGRYKALPDGYCERPLVADVSYEGQALLGVTGLRSLYTRATECLH